jgi:lipopolysaccharide export system protein LptA
MLSMNRPASLMMLSTIAVIAALSGRMDARAQIAPGGKGPVDVTADQLAVQQQQCLAVWSGSAEALQATSRLRADVLKIYNKVEAGKPAPGTPGSGQKCGALDRMEADGSVYYVTPDQVVKGDHAVYTAADTTIVMTGAEVIAAQGKNVITGTRLVINTDTGQANMQTDVSGRGKKGRVSGVFFPKSSDGQGGPPPPVPPPPRKHGA